MDPHELDRLLAAFLDGALDEPETLRLLEELRKDPQALHHLCELQEIDIAAEALARTDEDRRKLAAQIMLSIADTGRRERLAVAVLRDVRNEKTPTRGFHRPRPAPRPPERSVVAWVAAGLLLGVIFILMPAGPSPQESRPKARAPSPPDTIDIVRSPAPTLREAERAEAVERLAEIERRRRQLQEAKRLAEEAKEEDRLRKAEEELEKIRAQERDALEKLNRAQQQAKDPLPPAPPTVPSESRPQTTETPVARIMRVDGQANVLTAAGKIPAAASQELRGDQGIQTAGPGSALVLEYPDGTRLELGSDTSIRGLAENTLGKRLELTRGVLSAVVTQQPSGRPLVISTPHGVATVVGTTLRLLVDGSSTRLDVSEGTVLLKKSGGKTVEVLAGQYAVAAVGLDPVARRFLDGKQPAFIEVEEFGTARDAKPTHGLTWKPYLETDPTASGGHLVAAPTVGSDVSGEMDLVKARWYLWVRFRNEESAASVTFQVFAGGKFIGEGATSPGGQGWLWKRFEFTAAGLTRIVLRSTFKGVPDPNFPLTPFDAVNRWDRICLVRDEAFIPQ